MSVLASIIKEEMHKRNQIDNGLSEALEALILPKLNTAIGEAVNMAEYSTRVLQGLLSNPEMNDIEVDNLINDALSITSKLLLSITNPENLIH